MAIADEMVKKGGFPRVRPPDDGYNGHVHHIQSNIEQVQKRMELACKKVGRDPNDVRLMVVTKGRTIEEIKSAETYGLRVFGENKVQEAMKKWEKRDFPSDLHMIGHLQTNKVREAIKIFDVIESADNFKLLLAIHQEAAKLQKKIPVFIQINVSKDPKKFGILPENILQFFREANPLLVTGNIEVRGLMTIVEHTGSISARRPFFKEMKKIFDELKALFQEGHIEHVQMEHLSMGMSEDFEIAIEEGATIIRVGRAIFG